MRKIKGLRRKGDKWQMFVRVQPGPGGFKSKVVEAPPTLTELREWREHQIDKVHRETIYDPLSQALPGLVVTRWPRAVNGWCYVYFARSGDAVKIGRAADPHQRLRELQTAHPVDLVLVACVATHPELEGAIHDRFLHLRTKGEWFRLAPDLIGFIQAIRRGANPVELLYGGPTCLES